MPCNSACLARIMECFDISNISSTHIVPSMVRFKDGVPDRANYRRCRIKTASGRMILPAWPRSCAAATAACSARLAQRSKMGVRRSGPRLEKRYRGREAEQDTVTGTKSGLDPAQIEAS